jgi:hypothetical protein
MTLDEESTIRRVYAEASSATKVTGLSGLRAMIAGLPATAKVSSRPLGRPVTAVDVQRVMR